MSSKSNHANMIAPKRRNPLYDKDFYTARVFLEKIFYTFRGLPVPSSVNEKYPWLRYSGQLPQLRRNA
jgi:hypothetical protein